MHIYATYARAREFTREVSKVLEKEIETKLIDGIRKLGGRSYKFVSPGNNGVPDRIVILPGGRVIFVELKTMIGRLSKLQKMQTTMLSRLGCDVRVLYGEDGVRAFLEELIAEKMEERYAD